ncbi:growth regulating factor [Striga asiatica]|uniref:Growth regulating factor n=1 Tax=Striga asiatica TaxID=4170 RepID=A0A5A7PM17_STRAF|nr:growth regulating factor [Striga asiatica]
MKLIVKRSVERDAAAVIVKAPEPSPAAAAQPPFRASPPYGPVPAAAASTGFLERLRPLCMWRSQYLCPATTSLEHRHFLPSVRRHLPGSGSIAPFPQYPACTT